MERTISGRVSTKVSLQPCCAAPPKSRAESSSAMSCVPMAPSKIKTRSPSRRRYSDTLSTHNLSNLASGPIIHCRPRKARKRLDLARGEDAKAPQPRDEGRPSRTPTAIENLRDVAVALRDRRDARNALRAGLRNDLPVAGQHQLGIDLAGTRNILRMREHRVSNDAQRA